MYLGRIALHRLPIRGGGEIEKTDASALVFREIVFRGRDMHLSS